MSTYSGDKKEPIKCFLISGTDEDLFDFYKYYLRLKKLNQHTEYYITTTYSDDKTKQVLEEINSGKRINNTILSIHDRTNAK